VGFPRHRTAGLGVSGLQSSRHDRTAGGAKPPLLLSRHGIQSYRVARNPQPAARRGFLQTWCGPNPDIIRLTGRRNRLGVVMSTFRFIIKTPGLPNSVDWVPVVGFIHTPEGGGLSPRYRCKRTRSAVGWGYSAVFIGSCVIIFSTGSPYRWVRGLTRPICYTMAVQSHARPYHLSLHVPVTVPAHASLFIRECPIKRQDGRSDLETSTRWPLQAERLVPREVPSPGQR
jgi:hypothetical protein